MIFLGRFPQLGIEQGLQLVGLDLAVDDRLETTAQKLHRMMIFEEGRILAKDAAGIGLHDVLFQRDHSVPASQHEQLVEELEEILVGRLAVGGTLQTAERFLEHRNQYSLWGHNDHGAQACSANHDHFGELPEGADMATGHQESPDNRPENDEAADDDEHESCGDELLRRHLLSFAIVQFIDRGANGDDCLGVDLADTRFGQTENLGNLAEPEIFKIIESEHLPLHVG